MVNLFGMGSAELSELAEALGEPPFRARQLYSWLYRQRVPDIDAMTDVRKDLRARLAETHELRWPGVEERRSSMDGSIKYLFRLDDGASIESVYIPSDKRQTICISTQAGCPLKCGFCLTGVAGYTRNLRPWEILGQVAVVMHEAPASTRPWNVVLMGMGEPLLNVDATLASLRILMDKRGFAVAPRKLTLSTVGILPALERLAQEPVRPALAISLHAPNAELRRALMPVDERYPLEAVVAAARRYPGPAGGWVTYEYTLLGGVNDSPSQARELVGLLAGSRCKVNLIPLNPAPEIPFVPPSEAALDAFCRVLAGSGLNVSVRRSRGQDILAACGQLHLHRRAQIAGADAPGA
jgi:23S rRNA (adenine2503-C2)-methyltransferase